MVVVSHSAGCGATAFVQAQLNQSQTGLKVVNSIVSSIGVKWSKPHLKSNLVCLDNQIVKMFDEYTYII